ncbi:MAG: hypothetical protein SFV52_12125 [Saprospiraceae bacterium]|nr:hypothetical protein [Saprospiraceae bacterium]
MLRMYDALHESTYLSHHFDRTMHSARIVIAALLFSAVAFYNGFPLLTSDTGAYINNGYEIYLPEDRPLTYSFFLRYLSLGLTLWLPVLAQGLIISLLVYRICVLAWGERFSGKLFWILAVSTVAFTPVSWYSSQLMPDVFTGVLFLLVWLLYADPKRWNRPWYWIGLVVCNLMHNSHLLIMVMLSAGIIAMALRYDRQYLRTAFQLFGVSLFSMLLVASIHAAGGSGFTLSKGSHVFLVAKLSENGVLKKYLDDNCERYPYRLCAWKDKLPAYAWDFVWNADQPMQQLGGWEGTKTEFKAILRNIAWSPKYYTLLLYKALVDTGRQFVQTQVGDGLTPYGDNSNVYWKIHQYFDHEMPWHQASKQNNNLLGWAGYNWVYWFYLIVSSACLLFFQDEVKKNPLWVFGYVLLILFLLCNAFVTANFANVLARLQSRAIWVLPFFNLLFLLKYGLGASRK